MKIHIYEDEYFPYFGLADPDKQYEVEAEVNIQEWYWVTETLARFEKVQKFLKEKYNVRDSS